MLSDTSLARLAEVYQELKRRFIRLDGMLPSLNLQVTRGLATAEEQAEIWAQGRTSPGPIVTDAPAGYSAHEFGYALDTVPEDIMPGQPDWNLTHPAWKRLLAVAPSCGLAEGACWKKADNPHLYLEELPATPTGEMRLQLSSGGLAKVWANFPELNPWNAT